MEIETEQVFDDKVKKLAQLATSSFILECFVIIFLLAHKPMFYREIVAGFSIACALFFFFLSKRHSHCWFLIENQRTLTDQEKSVAWRRYFVAFAIPQIASWLVFNVLLFLRQ